MQNLKNRDFIMRHGQSKANEKGIIISNPKDGVKNYGLTEIGRRQVKKSALKNKNLDKNAIIFCSDVKRTRETAGIVREVIGIKAKINLKKILFVAHGDVLQILSTYFEKIDPGQHRSVLHLEVAEIRELT
ncbi:MAG: hypothetical protein GF347_00995 [Candidatus Moranbacteria bacterium]|nr:hypothetical protein [Candidatus Moranbacteria bacterium]